MLTRKFLIPTQEIYRCSMRFPARMLEITVGGVTQMRSGSFDRRRNTIGPAPFFCAVWPRVESYSASNTPAAPIPVPMHMVTSP